MRIRTAAAIAVGLAVFATAALAGGGGPKTKLVSKTSGGDPATGGSSNEPMVNPNGRFVVFQSSATNLPGDGSQIYRRDRDTGKTKLVSRTSNGDPAEGGESLDPAISASGRFVAFESVATNLPGALSGGDSQIYVRDLKQGKTKLVSKTTGGEPVDGNSDDPSISGNGRLVAFESETTDLPGGLGNEDQVYVRDLKQGKTKLVSKRSGGEPADSESDDQTISRNGRFVAFESNAANLPGAPGGGDDAVYVRDLDAGKTNLVSKTTDGESANDFSEDPMLSPNGRFVGFESFGSNLPGGGADTQVYLRDRKESKTVLVSKTTGGEPASGGVSENASVSDDGRFVAFGSQASNLPGGAADTEVYIRDRAAGKTRLVSKANDGSPTDASSFVSRNSSLLTADARFLVWTSVAVNLPGSIAPDQQVYIRGPLR